MAYIFLELEKIQEAVDIYNDILEADRNDIQSLLGMSKCYFIINELETCVDILERVIYIVENILETHQISKEILSFYKIAKINLADITMILNQDINKSKQIINSLKSIFPDDIEVNLMNAKILATEQKYEQAIKVCENILDTQNDYLPGLYVLINIQNILNKTEEVKRLEHKINFIHSQQDNRIHHVLH